MNTEHVKFVSFYDRSLFSVAADSNLKWVIRICSLYLRRNVLAVFNQSNRHIPNDSRSLSVCERGCHFEMEIKNATFIVFNIFQLFAKQIFFLFPNSDRIITFSELLLIFSNDFRFSFLAFLFPSGFAYTFYHYKTIFIGLLLSYTNGDPLHILTLHY